jgi:hypothetical protein
MLEHRNLLQERLPSSPGQTGRMSPALRKSLALNRWGSADGGAVALRMSYSKDCGRSCIAQRSFA